MQTTDLKPRSGVELIDASFQFLRQNFALLFTTVAVLYAPIALAEYMAAIDPGDVWRAAVSGLVTWFFSALAQAATITIVAARYMGENITSADALRAVWRRIGTVLIVTFAYGLIVGFCTMLLVVPGIYVAVKYFAAMAAAMVEGKSMNASMDRSAKLTEGSKMRVLGFFLVTIIVYLILNGAIAGVATALASPATGVLVARLSTAITNPFLFTLVTLVYFDLRIRREGLDLDFMMAPPAMPAAAPIAG